LRYSVTPNNTILIESAQGINEVSCELLEFHAHILFEKLITKQKKTFIINELSNFLELIHNPKLKAKNRSKRDISVAVLDDFSKKAIEHGFSIKSNFAANSSLLNASQATNFIFQVADESLHVLNGLKTKKLVRKLKELNFTPRFLKCDNPTYNHNLRLIDSQFPEILAHLLLEYYGGERGCKQLSELVNILEQKNPLQFDCAGLYQAKIEDFLLATALGMIPTVEWNRLYDADGGMIVVKETGELVTFYIVKQPLLAALRNYLFKNAFMDTASTKRHDFGYLYDKHFFKLNLLIRL
jgi:type II restriction enzyme